MQKQNVCYLIGNIGNGTEQNETLVGELAEIETTTYLEIIRRLELGIN